MRKILDIIRVARYILKARHYILIAPIRFRNGCLLMSDTELKPLNKMELHIEREQWMSIRQMAELKIDELNKIEEEEEND